MSERGQCCRDGCRTLTTWRARPDGYSYSLCRRHGGYPVPVPLPAAPSLGRPLHYIAQPTALVALWDELAGRTAGVSEAVGERATPDPHNSDSLSSNTSRKAG